MQLCSPGWRCSPPVSSAIIFRLPRTRGLHQFSLLCRLTPFSLLSPPVPTLSFPRNHLTTTATHHSTDAFYLNSVIKSHIDSGHFNSALSLFASTRAASRPDHFTLPLIVRAVSALDICVDVGRAVHCLGIQLGFGSNVYFCNALIDMYGKYGCMGSARRVFDEMPDRDVVSWTSVMSGCVQRGDVGESFRLLNEMRWDGVEPSSVSLAVVLRACGDGKDGGGVRQVFCFAVKRGFEHYELVQNSILMAFNKVGWFEEVEELFGSITKRSIVSWNVLMSGYASRGDSSKVIDCFEALRSEFNPTHQTLTLVISTFGKLGYLHRGEKLHGLALKNGHIDMVLEASLLDFYAKCGELASSVLLFEEVREKNSSVWSVMMLGFIQNGQFTDAISLFRRMQDFGYEPTVDTLRCLILAYTELGALQFGKTVHGYLVRNDLRTTFDLDALETSVLNMYAKCGCIVLARRCFDRMVHKDVIAWSSMVEGYAIHGHGSKALEIFRQMQKEGMEPNNITFLSLLSACSHSGLIHEGCVVFDSMYRKFGVQPELNHYTCMVDLLGRSGKLYEALEVINKMNSKPDARIWGALLASCRIHTDDMLGNYAAQKLFNLDPDNVGYHVVLSNIQVGEGKWDKPEKIRKDMNIKNFKKKPGWSCIQEKGRLYAFVAADTSHPQADEIYRVLVCLTWQTEQIGNRVQDVSS